jgi:hypothetical protein
LNFGWWRSLIGCAEQSKVSSLRSNAPRSKNRKQTITQRLLQVDMVLVNSRHEILSQRILSALSAGFNRMLSFVFAASQRFAHRRVIV